MVDFGLNLTTNNQRPINAKKGHIGKLNDREFLNPSNLFDFEMREGLISSNCHGQITQLIQENRSSIMASMSA